MTLCIFVFFFSSRRRHTRYIGDWSSDVCSSDLLRNERFPKGDRLGMRIVHPKNLHAPFHPEQHHADQLAPQVLPVHTMEEIGRASCRERVKVSTSAGR